MTLAVTRRRTKKLEYIGSKKIDQWILALHTQDKFTGEYQQIEDLVGNGEYVLMKSKKYFVCRAESRASEFRLQVRPDLPCQKQPMRQTTEKQHYTTRYWQNNRH